MREKPVDDLDRFLCVIDRHVHVHPEDQLTAGDVLQLVDERLVAILRGDVLPLEEAERVGPGRPDPHATLARDPGHVAA